MQQLCVCCCTQLNQNINAFQRKFVNEVRRCEEMERKLRMFWVSFFLSVCHVIDPLYIDYSD